MSLLPLLSCLLSAALFDVQVVPLNDGAYPFAVPSTGSKGVICVLDGPTVTVYPAHGAPRSLVFEPGTSAFDVADLDSDGQPDVVAVCGDRIRQYTFSEPATEPQTLFRLNNQFSGHSPKPYPYAFLVERDKKKMLALPCEETFEARALDGTSIASYPIGDNAPRRISYGRPFQSHSVFPTQAASPTAIENEVTRLIDFQPELPSDLLPLDSASTVARRVTGLQIREAGHLDATQWPWFRLKKDAAGTDRVLYALSPPEYRDTLVCIRKVDPVERIKDSDDDISPSKRYPGIPIVSAVPPDFNGDGYADLLLWGNGELMLSMDTITKTITTGAWPVTLSVHIFSPQKGRFEPSPAARLTVSVPIAWLISAESEPPVRYYVLEDFNGDGRTDLGCSLSPDTYTVWLYGQSGFETSPDFSYRTVTPITALAFYGDLEQTGRATIVLQTQNNLHILRPVKAAPSE